MAGTYDRRVPSYRTWTVPIEPTWEQNEAGTLLQILEEVAWEAYSTEGPAKVLQNIARSVTKKGPWKICWAALYNKEGTAIEFEVYHGLDDEQPWNHLDWPVEGSPSMLSCQLGSILTFTDIRKATEFPRVVDDAHTRGFAGVAIVPLRAEDRLGALWLCTREPHEFSEAEVLFATVVGALAATSLGASLHFETERQLRLERQRQLTELEALHGLVAAQNQRLKHQAEIHEALLREILADQDTPKLIERMSKLISRPVMLAGHDLVPIAFSGIEPDGADEILRLIDSDRPRLATLRAFTPHRLCEIPTGGSIISVPLRVLGRTLAFLLVVDRNAEEDPEELYAVLEHCSLLISLDRLKDWFRLNAELRASRDLVEALGSAETDPLTIMRRASALGLDLTRSAVVLKVRLEDSELPLNLEEVFASSIRMKLQPLGVDSIAVPVGAGEFTVITTLRDTNVARSQIAETIRASVEQTSRLHDPSMLPAITIAVGTAASGVQGMRRSYREAERAMMVAITQGAVGSTVDASQLGVYGLLVELGSDVSLTFAQSQLAELLAYDSKHGSDLLATLEAYLDSMGNVNQTARRMFLHPSTVRYRISRIEEVTSLNLDNPERRLMVHLAIRILRLYGGYPTPPPSGRIVR